MAEIEYRPKIDTSDLAAQLQEVRNQINQAVAAQTFATTVPSPQPQAFAFPLDAAMGMSMAGNDMRSFGGSMQTAAQNGASAAQNAVAAARLGFQKFNNDIQNNALTAAYQDPFTGSGNFPVFNPKNYYSNWAATSFGYGFDPSMSVTPGRYRERAMEAMAEGTLAQRFGMGGSVVGGTLGMFIGGPMGAATGAWLGGMAGDFAYDATEASIARNYSTGKNIRNYIRETSWRTLGGRMDREEAGAIGLEASRLATSTTTQGYNLTRDDIERVTKQYTEMGGFDLVRSAEDYRSKLKSVIEDHRKVMQVLKLSEQDALAAMKDLNTMGVDPGKNAIGIAAMAYSAGYSPKEFLRFAGQSAEMVRGTGIDMSSAFLGGMASLSMIKYGMQEDFISKQLVAHSGGAENMTLNMQRRGYDWATSMSGFTQLAADAAMGGPGRASNLNTVETLSTAVGALTKGGIQGILEYQGTQNERISQYSPMGLVASNTMQWIKQMEMMESVGVKINQASFRAILQQNGISTTEADQMWSVGNVAQQIARKGSGYYEKMAKEAQTVAIQAVPDKLDILKDRIYGSISDAFDWGSDYFNAKDNEAFKENQRNVERDSYGTIKLNSDGTVEQADGFSKTAIKQKQDALRAAGKKNASEFDAKVALAKENTKRLEKELSAASSFAGNLITTNESVVRQVFKGKTDAEVASLLSQDDMTVRKTVADAAKAVGMDVESTADSVMGVKEKYSASLTRVHRLNAAYNQQKQGEDAGFLTHVDQEGYYKKKIQDRAWGDLAGTAAWVTGRDVDGTTIRGAAEKFVRGAIAPIAMAHAGAKYLWDQFTSTDSEKQLELQNKEMADAGAAVKAAKKQQAEVSEIFGKALGRIDFSGKSTGTPDQVMAEVNARMSTMNTEKNTRETVDWLKKIEAKKFMGMF